MRAGLTVLLLIASALAGCASTRQAPSATPGYQAGPLSVHPDLYGRKKAPAQPAVAPAPAPVAAPLPTPAAAPAAANPAPAAAPDSATAPAPAAAPAPVTGGLAVSKDLKAHLRSERSFYFDLDKSDLKPDYDPVLKAHASYLAEHPEARVRIEGHADERGGREYNRKLGLSRAEIVRAELLKRGAPEPQVGMKSYGETRPRLKGHDEESWAENRRADVIYEAE